MRMARQIDVDDTTSAALIDAVPCALVIGNFDGVHLGHKAVLDQAVRHARANGWATSALTFDPHPAEVVGSGAPPLLTSMRSRVELMGAALVDRVYVRRFDAAFATWPPTRFANDLVASALHAKLVVVGQSFRFGAKRAGDLALLRSLGERAGFDVQMAPVARDAMGPYSSTRVRDALASGDLDTARNVLGRPHAIAGVVVHGDARGRTIGFPTANLGNVVEMLPGFGVYAARVERETESGLQRQIIGDAVANIGVRPTLGGGGRPTIEAHLLRFDGDLYGARLKLHLFARLRTEKKFSSLDALKAQIARDAEDAAAVLARE